jgi:hypothetical protein
MNNTLGTKFKVINGYASRRSICSLSIQPSRQIGSAKGKALTAVLRHPTPGGQIRASIFTGDKPKDFHFIAGTPREGKLPRYFFVIHDVSFFDDESGTLLDDEAAAETHARQIIRELKATGDFDNAEWMITVKNELGQEVVSIPFKEVLTGTHETKSVLSHS